MNDRLKGRLGRHRTSVKDTAWTSNGQPSHYSQDDDDDVGDGDGDDGDDDDEAYHFLFRKHYYDIVSHPLYISRLKTFDENLE